MVVETIRKSRGVVSAAEYDVIVIPGGMSPDVLGGKNVTAYPSVAKDLIGAGANYSDVPVMRDGNIITSRMPEDLPDFVRAI